MSSNDKLSVAIILPVHKPFNDLAKNELQSLKQLSNVLSGVPLCIVAPEGFCLKEYFNFFSGQNVSVEWFKEACFETVHSYNQLCLSRDFYRRFFRYDYILIYQPDAYVFRNELEQWMRQGYDFIGAPFHKNNEEPFNENLWTVGNGGFSLRSVKKCYELLSRIEFYYFIFKVFKKLKAKKVAITIFKKTGLADLVMIDKIKRNVFNEDYVFGVLSKQIDKGFKVAPLQEAWKFSFEAHPAHLYKLNNYQLPFGCHGWDVYDPEFWKNFIQQ